MKCNVAIASWGGVVCLRRNSGGFRVTIVPPRSSTIGRALLLHLGDIAFVMEASLAVVPFAPDVFTSPTDDPQLIGGRCKKCAAVTFPAQASCPRCGSTEMERHLLPRRGRIWSWTTQEFLPKAPYASGETQATFKPFGIGLIQLGDEVRVEARLTESDPAKLRIGGEVELVIVPFRVQDDAQVVTFAFRPI